MKKVKLINITFTLLVWFVLFLPNLLGDDYGSLIVNGLTPHVKDLTVAQREEWIIAARQLADATDFSGSSERAFRFLVDAGDSNAIGHVFSLTRDTAVAPNVRRRAWRTIENSSNADLLARLALDVRREEAANYLTDDAQSEFVFLPISMMASLAALKIVSVSDVFDDDVKEWAIDRRARILKERIEIRGEVRAFFRENHEALVAMDYASFHPPATNE